MLGAAAQAASTQAAVLAALAALAAVAVARRVRGCRAPTGSGVGVAAAEQGLAGGAMVSQLSLAQPEHAE